MPMDYSKVEKYECQPEIVDIAERRTRGIFKCWALGGLGQHYDLRVLILSVYLQGLNDGVAVAEKKFGQPIF